MTTNELNKKIAEKCGWEYKENHEAEGRIAMECGDAWKPPGKQFSFDAEPPSYFTDLNAVHEAEKVLDGMSQVPYYATLAEVVTGNDLGKQGWQVLSGHDKSDIARATAMQRAVALGLTWGLITKDQADELLKQPTTKQ